MSKEKKSEDQRPLHGKFAHEYSRLNFPSHKSEQFRGRLYSTGETVLLWLEGKKSKDQWQSEIKEECGPAGIPADAVIALLKKALADSEVKDSSASENPPSSDAPLVDKCGEHVKLTLNMCGGVWKPEFVYPLTSVGVDQIDVLEAKVRDLQEEVGCLKQVVEDLTQAEPVPPVYLSLASNVAAAHDQPINWSAPFDQRSQYDDEFTLSADGMNVTVLQEGLYQAYVRVCGTNNSNSESLKLNLNGTLVASCHQSSHGSHQNTAHIQEILHLKEGDVLQVVSHFNQNSLNVITGNRFTLLKLGN